MNLLTKLHIFQKERFPLRILLFTTASSILSSAAVSPSKPSILLMILAFVSTLLFLYHIRVIDESRDLEMDSSLHPERPVQRGIVSLKELFFTTIVGLAICILISIYAGFPAMVITLAVLVFTTFAWRDFFAKKFFSTRPVLYHIINSPQMILVQWNIYAIYTESFQITWLMLLQLLLVYNSIFIIEVVRKIKAPVIDTPDSYSASMGTNKSIYFSIAMVFSGFAIFSLLLSGLGAFEGVNIFLGVMVSLSFIGIMLLHSRIKSVFTEQLMVVAAVIYYVAMNLIIYLSTL
ncbi:MAG: UbiA family prenyltransferase [Tenuifilaceae bacterium]|jgi:4-hydroxybenzoate polyprenyltransferase|nr:UbiA family prenyltransferase [Tenuifilaceae bacterium]